MSLKPFLNTEHEFNCYLLKVAKELTSNDVDQLKFIFKNVIPPANSERTKEAFHYFEELERKCLLSPTKFDVLKNAFDTIGRNDLVEALEEKEEYFATLSQNGQKAVPAKFNTINAKNEARLLPTIAPENQVDKPILEEEQCNEVTEVWDGGSFDPHFFATNEEGAIVDASSSGKKKLCEDVVHDGVDEDAAHRKTFTGEHKNAPNKDGSEMERKQPVKDSTFTAQGARPKSLFSGEDRVLEQDAEGGSKTIEHGTLTSTLTRYGDHLSSSRPMKEPTEDEYSQEATVTGSINKEGPSVEQKVHQTSFVTTASPGSVAPRSMAHQSSSTYYSGIYTVDSGVMPTSYKKGNYSVRINPGSLVQYTVDMGVVLMESGQSFEIEIMNQNEYAAEVDINFGGKYLGLWLVEARQSNPLIIRGSAYERGRLTYFSATDRNSGSDRACGKIEFEFKPEALRLFAQRRSMDHKYEVLVTNFNTASVSDLRRQIERRYGGQIGKISYLVIDGQILENQRTIRSYGITSNDTVQVLSNHEELLVSVPEFGGPYGYSAFALRSEPRSSGQLFRGNPLPYCVEYCETEEHVMSDGCVFPLKEGKAVLRGNDDFSKQFMVDLDNRRFSKEGAVKMTIQLVSRETTASKPPEPQRPSPVGRGPMSTPCPPPVPE